MFRSERSGICSRLPTVLAGAIAIESGRLSWDRSVTPREAGLFRVVNGLPDGLLVPTWVVMQAGSLGAVAVASAFAWRSNQRKAAIALAAAGGGVWALAKVLKRLVRRGRPDAHLEGVVVRGGSQTGLGYPSGHAAVAMAMAAVGASGSGTAIRSGLYGVAAYVAGARVYVGAHLPLDVAGGAALGFMAGAMARCRLLPHA